MTREQKQIYDAIAAVKAQKREKRVFPDFCLEIELSLHLGQQNARKATEIAGELENMGLIRTGRTLNYRYYDLTDVTPDDIVEAELVEPQSDELLF